MQVFVRAPVVGDCARAHGLAINRETQCACPSRGCRQDGPPGRSCIQRRSGEVRRDYSIEVTASTSPGTGSTEAATRSSFTKKASVATVPAPANN